MTGARLLEREDGLWAIYVRIAGRSGEYRVNVYRSDEPKTYSDVARASETIRREFGYRGPIVLVTEKCA